MNPVDELPQELWFMVIEFLSPFEALQLRASCASFNRTVTGHQTYWYRQFAWFLVVENKWRAAVFKTGCGRHHKPEIPRSAACLSHEQEVAYATAHQITPEQVSALIAQRPETVTDVACSNPLHYTYELPKSRFSIPIVPSDFHPKEQFYMYRFLIHNYRRRRQRAKRYTSATAVKSQIKHAVVHLRKLEAEAEKTREKLKGLSAMHRELELLETNNIFFGSKSRQYPRRK